eukprot:m51a1_g10747 putative membrane bound o-acyl transferase family protein (872) ;mRNA; r:348982-354169
MRHAGRPREGEDPQGVLSLCRPAAVLRVSRVCSPTVLSSVAVAGTAASPGAPPAAAAASAEPTAAGDDDLFCPACEGELLGRWRLPALWVGSRAELWVPADAAAAVPLVRLLLRGPKRPRTRPPASPEGPEDAEEGRGGDEPLAYAVRLEAVRGRLPEGAELYAQCRSGGRPLRAGDCVVAVRSLRPPALGPGRLPVPLGALPSSSSSRRLPGPAALWRPPLRSDEGDEDESEDEEDEDEGEGDRREGRSAEDELAYCEAVRRMVGYGRLPRECVAYGVGDDEGYARAAQALAQRLRKLGWKGQCRCYSESEGEEVEEEEEEEGTPSITAFCAIGEEGWTPGEEDNGRGSHENPATRRVRPLVLDGGALRTPVAPFEDAGDWDDLLTSFAFAAPDCMGGWRVAVYVPYAGNSLSPLRTTRGTHCPLQGLSQLLDTRPAEEERRPSDRENLQAGMAEMAAVLRPAAPASLKELAARAIARKGGDLPLPGKDVPEDVWHDVLLQCLLVSRSVPFSESDVMPPWKSSNARELAVGPEMQVALLFEREGRAVAGDLAKLALGVRDLATTQVVGIECVPRGLKAAFKTKEGDKYVRHVYEYLYRKTDQDRDVGDLSSLKLSPEDCADDSSRRRKFVQLTGIGYFVRFICFPTLCFYLEYPRSRSVNWWKVLLHLAQFVVSLSIAYIALTEAMLPEWKNIVDDPVGVVLRTLMPGFISWMAMFFGIFHAMLNFVAEIARYKDRRFYGEWWEAKDMTTWWREWNCCVSDWMRRHVYFQAIQDAKFPSFVSMLCVFAVSSLWHEYVLMVGLRTMRPILGPIMLAQVAMMVGMNHRFFRNTPFGNMFVWFAFIVGYPLVLNMYAFSWCIDHPVECKTVSW